jgi:hypothetical protein
MQTYAPNFVFLIFLIYSQIHTQKLKFFFVLPFFFVFYNYLIRNFQKIYKTPKKLKTVVVEQ